MTAPEDQQGSETLAQLAQYNSGQLPVGDAQKPDPEPEPPEPAPAEPVPEIEEEAPPQAASSGIIVDGKEFASEKEAYQYAQEKLKQVETEKLLIEARQEGIEAALSRQAVPQAVQPEVQPDEDVDSDAYYADPVGYIRQKEAAIAAKVKADIESQIQAQRADEQLWGEFFSANPDLQGFKSDCEQALNAHMETVKVLASKDKKKAFDFLATKTRQKFQDYMEAVKPRHALPNSGGAPSHGTNPGVTQAKTAPKDDEPLDFVSQMRSMNNM